MSLSDFESLREPSRRRTEQIALADRLEAERYRAYHANSQNVNVNRALKELVELIAANL